MRNKTQERIEELARERAASTIDLALVEDGIEIGKKMMAEMIATYPTAGTGAPAAPLGAEALAKAAPVPVGHDVAPRNRALIAEAQSKAQVVPAGNGSGYLNEVSSLTATPRQV